MTLILFAFIPSFLFAAADDISVTITLPDTINVTGVDREDAEQKLSGEVQLIVQPAIDALLMDRPEIAVWLDVTGTRFSFSYSIGNDGDGNCVIGVSKLFLNIKSDPDVYDPNGMVSGLRDLISSFSPSGNTRYDAVRSIHDFVCGLTVYDYDAADGKPAGSKFAHHAFGALIDGKAVCQGYSEAFKLICDAHGIPCVLVSGTAISNKKTEQHMWCCVRMENGVWYAVDPTWDDGTKIKYDYLLVGSGTKISKKAFSSTHTPDGDLSNTGLKEFSYPEISTSKYSESGVAYGSEFPENGWFFSQLNSDQKAIYEQIASIEPPEGNPKYVYTPPVTTVTETESETVPQIVITDVTTIPDHNPVTDSDIASQTSDDIPVTSVKDPATDLTSETEPVIITETDDIFSSDSNESSGVISSAIDYSDTLISDTADSGSVSAVTLSPGDEITDGRSDECASSLPLPDVTGEKTVSKNGSSSSQNVSESDTDDKSEDQKPFDFKRILHVAFIVVAIIAVFTAITFVIVRIGKSDVNNREV